MNPIAAGWKTLDMATPQSFARETLCLETQQNVAIFSNPSYCTRENMCIQAVSPFTGKRVAPTAHFGIDSDPWMHSVLYANGESRFIIVCQGLTSSSTFGALLLPDRNILLTLRHSWYFQDIIRVRMARNLPRILGYFASRQLPQVQAGLEAPMPIIAAIGNGRPGDYLQQLAWLEHLLTSQCDHIQIEKVLVNTASEFFHVETLFPELAQRVERHPSISHIEYQAREYQVPLVSDARPLSDRNAMHGVRKRFRTYAARSAQCSDVARILAPLADCPLVLWLSLELEKRVWVGQEPGLSQLLSAIAHRYLRGGESLGLVFNGLTGVESGGVPANLRSLVARESDMAQRIAQQVAGSVRFVSLAEASLRTKTSVAARVDFVLAPIGPASVVPALLLGKPGVVYGSRSGERASFAGENTSILPDSHIEQAPDRGAVDWGTRNCQTSYSLDWREIYQCMVESFDVARTAGGRLSFRHRSDTARAPASWASSIFGS